MEADGEIELTDRAISGRELIGADLVDIAKPIGTVEEIILDDRGQTSFVGYETSRFRDLDGEGYLAVKKVAIESNIPREVEIDLADTTTRDDPEDIRLSEAEQQKRMLSNILNDEVMAGDEVYNIRDVVFDRSGKAHFLIVSEPGGSLFRQGEAYALPFSAVSYEQGAWRTNGAVMPLATVASADQR